MMVYSSIITLSFVLICISKRVDGNISEVDIIRFREDMMSDVDVLKQKLKEVSEKRQLITKEIYLSCNSSIMYKSLRGKMRDLMRKFTNISIELNLLTGNRKINGSPGQKGVQSKQRVVVSNYIDVIDHIKSLHSSLDDMETEMWKQDFNRVINERRLQKVNRRMISRDFIANVKRMAIVGLDDTAGIIEADTEESLEKGINRKAYSSLNRMLVMGYGRSA